MPGKQIRFPIEDKGRFTPIDKEDWRVKHTIGINPGLSKIHIDDSGAGDLLDKKE